MFVIYLWQECARCWLLDDDRGKEGMGWDGKLWIDGWMVEWLDGWMVGGKECFLEASRLYCGVDGGDGDDDGNIERMNKDLNRKKEVFG